MNSIAKFLLTPRIGGVTMELSFLVKRIQSLIKILFYLLRGAIIQKKIYFPLIGIKKSLSNFLKNYLIIMLILFIIYSLFFDSFDRFSKFLDSSSLDQYFINFLQISGFRAYYCIASLLYGITNLLSIPGDWVEQFKPYLYF